MGSDSRTNHQTGLGNGLFFLWTLCLVALFIPKQLYVGIFAGFIFFGILYALLQFSLVKLTARWLALALVGGAYIIWASVVYFSQREYSDGPQYLKLVLNIAFLVTSALFFELRKARAREMLRGLERVLAVIILLSAVQVAHNVWVLGAWTWPFSGHISNSSAAYLIAQPGVWFGGEEKNIWASKLAFVLSLYAVIQWYKGSVFRLLPLIVMGFGLFNVVYTFGRTAQLMVAVLIALGVYFWFSRLRYWFFRYISLGTFVLSVPLAAVALASFLRFNSSLFDISEGAQGDGFRARLLLWRLLWTHSSDFNFIWGNGVLYGQYYLSEIVVRANNNFHNVFLNNLVDFGVLGLLLYIGLLLIVFYRRKPTPLTWLLALPLLACLSLQYVGYDNDVVVYLAACWLIFQTVRMQGSIQ